MRLQDAICLATRTPGPNAPVRKIRLFCGFTPSYVEVFLKAVAASRWGGALEVETGLFGDLANSIERAAARQSAETAVIVEWADIDARLGFRSGGGWGREARKDMVAGAAGSFNRLLDGIRKLAASSTVIVCGPTLPLPPISHTAGCQADAFELEMRKLAAEFREAVGGVPGVRVLAPARLEALSPPDKRLDLKLDLLSGAPYTVEHASAVGTLIGEALFPPPPRKGLITDLDDTLWNGILGEQGCDGIFWDLEHGSQIHGLYQQALAVLAENGVLVGIATKNEPELVERALNRSDLLIPRDRLFPVAAGWGPKSESVERILAAWNIAADSAVFIDDSPTELAEVQSKHPGIECIRFDKNHPNLVWEMLLGLRDRFGKPVLSAEDSYRAVSLRAASEIGPRLDGQDSGEFLRQLGGTVTLDFRKEASGPRALELVNKTNQFNLNGRRYAEGEWGGLLHDPDSFVLTVSYGDKFGPLGRIAVVAGAKDGGLCRIGCWVMSCRAFSRCIEFHTLAGLFERFQCQELRLDFAETGRNGPLREFLALFAAVPQGAGGIMLAREAVQKLDLQLPHEVVVCG
jgi:FkbH-like protein